MRLYRVSGPIRGIGPSRPPPASTASASTPCTSSTPAHHRHRPSATHPGARDRRGDRRRGCPAADGRSAERHGRYGRGSGPAGRVRGGVDGRPGGDPGPGVPTAAAAAWSCWCSATSADSATAPPAGSRIPRVAASSPSRPASPVPDAAPAVRRAGGRPSGPRTGAGDDDGLGHLFSGVLGRGIRPRRAPPVAGLSVAPTDKRGVPAGVTVFRRTGQEAGTVGGPTSGTSRPRRLPGTGGVGRTGTVPRSLTGSVPVPFPRPGSRSCARPSRDDIRCVFPPNGRPLFAGVLRMPDFTMGTRNSKEVDDNGCLVSGSSAGADPRRHRIRRSRAVVGGDRRTGDLAAGLCLPQCGIRWVAGTLVPMVTA
jgi:hypothetical protein